MTTETTATTIPGLTELTAARIAEANYQDACSDAIERGSRYPKALTVSASAIAIQYPLAAAYLDAQGQWEMSSDDRKASAGKRAMGLIEQGGDAAAAREIMKNWLPASAAWN